MSLLLKKFFWVVDILSSGFIAIIALISEALIDLDPVYLEVVLDF